MQISQMIALMGNLSVGLDNVTREDQNIFLQYLNLAHFELYQDTANINQDIFINEVVVSNYNVATLSHIPFLIISAFDVTNRNSLEESSLSDILHDDPIFTDTGYPESFFVQKNLLNFHPIQTSNVTMNVWYAPQPQSLTLATAEVDIPYPTAFHPVLVDGALRYLFQDEAGFKNPVQHQAADKRWEVGKSRLFAYLFNTKGSHISTFQSV